jgi:hypothetical protein
MANKYVSKSGNNANDGTSWAQAWLTLNHALGATGIVSGDVLYVGGDADGSTVYREVVTPAMTSATGETIVQAVVTGTTTPTRVRHTAYLTNDSTAPGAAAPLVMNGRDYLTFRRFDYGAGTVQCVNATTTVSTNCKFEDCTFTAGTVTAQAMIGVTSTASTALNWTIDRCAFLVYGGATSGTYGIQVNAPTLVGADYDLNFLVQNCLFNGPQIGVILSPSGASANRPGGVDVMNCTFVCGNWGVFANSNTSTSIPCTVTNSLILATIGVQGQSASMLTENYNIIYAATPRTNVTAGANSTSDGSKALRVYLGHGFTLGQQARPYMAPFAGSPLLGAGTNTGAPTVDMLGTTRPNPPSIGCFELWTIPGPARRVA